MAGGADLCAFQAFYLGCAAFCIIILIISEYISRRRWTLIHRGLCLLGRRHAYSMAFVVSSKAHAMFRAHYALLRSWAKKEEEKVEEMIPSCDRCYYTRPLLDIFFTMTNVRRPSNTSTVFPSMPDTAVIVFNAHVPLQSRVFQLMSDFRLP